jgi:Na+/H+ antiporter NhaC
MDFKLNFIGRFFMKQKEFQRWQKYRKMGQLKFTLLWVLYFIMVLNVAILGANVIDGSFNFKIEGFFIRLIIGGLVGVFNGTMMWKRNEEEYNNHLNKNDSI